MELESYQFPSDSVICEPGDYLLCSDPEGRINVFLVTDLVRVQRLIPMRGQASGSVLLEKNLLDSRTPAYHDEVYLVVTSFQPQLSSQDEAVAAIAGGRVTEKATGLLRSSSEFPRSRCRVHRPDG